MIGADAVEVGQHQRVGEEDRVVEEGLRGHQREADERALALVAKQRARDLGQRRERRACEPHARQRCPVDGRARGVEAGLDHRRRSPPLPATRPCVISQRGDSGIHIRMTKMMRPSTAPIRKASRQPRSGLDHRRIEQHDRAGRAERRADPEAAVDHEVGPAAIARRHQFLNGRIDRGVFAADAGAGQEAEHREARHAPGQRGRRGRDQIDRERDEEQPLAAEPVGEPAEATARRAPRRPDRRC